MSQAFVAASSQGLTSDSPPPFITTVPFTFAAWIKSAAFTENAVLFNIKTNAALDTGEVYFIVTTVSGTKRLRVASHGVGDVSSSNALATGQWVCAIVRVKNGLFTIDLDGTKTTGSVTTGLAGYTRFGIGCYWDGSALSNAGDWLIAEASLWNFEITDAEAAAILAGAPLHSAIRPGGLCGHWNLINGVLRPEARGVVLTNQGSSVSDSSHPRVFRSG